MIDKQEENWFYECTKCGGEVPNTSGAACEVCKACICDMCLAEKEVYCFECGHRQQYF